MKPDMTDKELDDLISELSAPDLPKGLVTDIMARLPERKTGWRAYLADLLGIDRLSVPAGGALASLVFGLLAGYTLVPATTVGAERVDETEIELAAAFGSGSWLEFDEETR